ncbi:hypothetical protein BP5796_12915 [Coleophoma crateriformis]|uniref:RTA1-domain-containing protein n=1 Tax=Coleophoma crateriformis TaxID=565419 RepID=A0A3D8Q5C1_9HELO|nr:hypothetical protein BP5796_12915 [Coleophoma crateriformis]
MAELKPLKSGYYIWTYLPSQPAAAIFAILFIVSSLAHIWFLVQRRTWFCIVLTIGCIMEALGFAIRIQAHDNTDKLMPYIIQNLFILLAPIFFAATIYMTLSRVIRSVPHGASCSMITPQKLTRVFVTGDILSLVIQGNSTPLTIIANGKYAKYSNYVVMLGLLLQLVMFAVFGITAMVFHKRYSRRSSLAGNDLWRKQIHMLYVVSVLIMVRSIYRMIEYATGTTGYLMTHEWALYLFDATLMWIATVVFLIYYPSQLAAKMADPDDSQYISLYPRKP